MTHPIPLLAAGDLFVGLDPRTAEHARRSAAA
jgi:hypothetical protein